MAIISRRARVELVHALAERYLTSSKIDKTRILDEFVRLTGHHRKHAVRVLRGQASATEHTGTSSRPRLYDEAVRQALVVLWEASDRICGKRLRPLLPQLISSLERHAHLQLEADIREKVLSVSASTIDRLLAPARATTLRKSRNKPPAIRSQVPVRTFDDWNDPLPGFMEMDLVAHCGGVPSGRYNHTLTLTDISSGWTECIALAVRDSSLVVSALTRLLSAMPFTLRGIDTDNGGEFVNDLLLEFSRDHDIEFTRSRPYRKNDQAWVEQKNGSVVRRIVGYGRLEGVAAAESLARLYCSSRLFVNFFQPSFKLLRKERIGARVRKHYATPETPASRLLASPGVADAAKEKLRAVLASLDPLRLLDEIRTMQRHIAGLGRGEQAHTPPHRDLDLERFLASLATAWMEGEVRPTHQRKPMARRTWRTRVDPFEKVWPKMLVWLENDPDRTAKELFARLREENPSAFRAGQLRTLQRRVKEWRMAAARRLVLSESDASKGRNGEVPDAALGK
ncbi:MAG: transposase family protein [Gammaproteobacteria bacterium]|nr:transposase family protein [Gammaproteobacteria bacterium]